MVSWFVKWGSKKAVTTGKEVIKKLDVGKQLTRKRKLQDESVRFTDKLHKGLSTETKNKLKQKNPLHKYLEKQRKNIDRD